MRAIVVGVLFAAAACGARQPASVPAASVAGEVPERATKYRVGDFVVYRYSGTFSDEAVTMREEVAAQDGLRLRIDVTATRGPEQRRWVQVVTDTPENERSNVIDALYEWKDGGFAKLANEKNADILRLSSWVLVEPDGRATDVRQTSCREKILDVEHACRCTSGVNELHGQPITFRAVDCDDFLWTHAGAFFRDVAGDVLRVEVIEAGRVANVPPKSLTPDDPTAPKVDKVDTVPPAKG